MKLYITAALLICLMSCSYGRPARKIRSLQRVTKEFLDEIIDKLETNEMAMAKRGPGGPPRCACAAGSFCMKDADGTDTCVANSDLTDVGCDIPAVDPPSVDADEGETLKCLSSDTTVLIKCELENNVEKCRPARPPPGGPQGSSDDSSDDDDKKRDNPPPPPPPNGDGNPPPPPPSPTPEKRHQKRGPGGPPRCTCAAGSFCMKAEGGTDICVSNSDLTDVGCDIPPVDPPSVDADDGETLKCLSSDTTVLIKCELENNVEECRPARPPPPPGGQGSSDDSSDDDKKRQGEDLYTSTDEDISSSGLESLDTDDDDVSSIPLKKRNPSPNGGTSSADDGPDNASTDDADPSPRPPPPPPPAKKGTDGQTFKRQLKKALKELLKAADMK